MSKANLTLEVRDGGGISGKIILENCCSVHNRKTNKDPSLGTSHEEQCDLWLRGETYSIIHI